MTTFCSATFLGTTMVVVICLMMATYATAVDVHHLNRVVDAKAKHGHHSHHKEGHYDHEYAALMTPTPAPTPAPTRARRGRRGRVAPLRLHEWGMEDEHVFKTQDGSADARIGNFLAKNGCWMTKSYELLGDLKLNELVVPGTHDSAAWQFVDANECQQMKVEQPSQATCTGNLESKAITLYDVRTTTRKGEGTMSMGSYSGNSGAIKTQIVSVAKLKEAAVTHYSNAFYQLRSGARFFDLRAYYDRSKSKWIGDHGGVYFGDISQILDEMAMFSKTYGSCCEIVFVKLKIKCKGTKVDKEYVPCDTELSALHDLITSKLAGDGAKAEIISETGTGAWHNYVSMVNQCNYMDQHDVYGSLKAVTKTWKQMCGFGDGNTIMDKIQVSTPSTGSRFIIGYDIAGKDSDSIADIKSRIRFMQKKCPGDTYCIFPLHALMLGKSKEALQINKVIDGSYDEMLTAQTTRGERALRSKLTSTFWINMKVKDKFTKKPNIHDNSRIVWSVVLPTLLKMGASPDLFQMDTVQFWQLDPSQTTYPAQFNFDRSQSSILRRITAVPSPDTAIDTLDYDPKVLYRELHSMMVGQCYAVLGMNVMTLDFGEKTTPIMMHISRMIMTQRNAIKALNLSERGKRERLATCQGLKTQWNA